MIPVVISTGYRSTIDDSAALKPFWRFDMSMMVFDDEFATPFVLEQNEDVLHPKSDEDGATIAK